MIEEKDLKRLDGWGLEYEGSLKGSYTDRWQFAIRPTNRQRTEWALWTCSEVNNDHDEFICDLNDFEHLIYMYWTLAYDELVIKPE